LSREQLEKTIALGLLLSVAVQAREHASAARREEE
jgi:hypothetical protein